MGARPWLLRLRGEVIRDSHGHGCEPGRWTASEILLRGVPSATGMRGHFPRFALGWAALCQFASFCSVSLNCPGMSPGNRDQLHWQMADAEHGGGPAATLQIPPLALPVPTHQVLQLKVSGCPRSPVWAWITPLPGLDSIST